MRYLSVWAEHNAEVRAGPFQPLRRRNHVRKPQRHAVVVGEREPQALRRECKRADARRRLERLVLALVPAHERGLAGGPCNRAVGMDRDVVDPAAFCVGHENRALALRIERDHVAVVAAGDDPRTIRSRRQDRAAVNGDRNLLAVAGNERDVSSSPTNAARSPMKYTAATGASMVTGRTRSTAEATERSCGGSSSLIMRLRTSQSLRESTSSGNSRPMNTRRLSRFSSGFHLRWRLPSSIMWTP